MRKLLVLLLVIGLVIICVGVVSAAFTVTPSKTSANVSESITFTVSGLDTTSLSKYVWSFGDSSSSQESGTNPSMSHTYSAAGSSYTVTVTAQNATGTTLGNATCSVNINALPTLVAGFSLSPTGGAAPLEVSFTDTSTGSPTSYRWEFGDENISTDRNPTHTFREAKMYTITLTVRSCGADFRICGMPRQRCTL